MAVSKIGTLRHTYRRKAATAEHYDVGIRTVDRWVLKGMPCYRPSPQVVLFDWAETDAWLQQFRAGREPSVPKTRGGRPRQPLPGEREEADL